MSTGTLIAMLSSIGAVVSAVAEDHAVFAYRGGTFRISLEPFPVVTFGKTLGTGGLPVSVLRQAVDSVNSSSLCVRASYDPGQEAVCLSASAILRSEESFLAVAGSYLDAVRNAEAVISGIVAGC